MSDINEIDTSNKFCVAGQGTGVVFLLPIPRRMTYKDALNLAAYIVAMNADEDLWQRTLDAVRNA